MNIVSVRFGPRATSSLSCAVQRRGGCNLLLLAVDVAVYTLTSPYYKTMQWYNEPKDYIVEDNKITIQVPGKTDYWRVTLHDFIKDDAPFYYQTVNGDFEATVKIIGEYHTLYDQAGLMVRHDEKVWMKCGIEYYKSKQHASTVITRDFSDWSILPLHNPVEVWFRCKRTGACIETYYSTDGVNFLQIRQGYLSEAKDLQVGVMCAAPQGDGFQVVLEDFEVVSVDS